MSRFSTLHQGEPAEVMAELEEEPASEQELRAALQNAFRHIGALEARLAKMDRTLKAHLDTVS